jgi:DNA-binding transcriptional MocR family regulator
VGELTQFQPVPGVIDLAWGHPDPTLLPVQQLRAAAERAMDRYGTEMLAYGNPAGPPPLIEFICDRLSLTDGRAPTPAEVVITSGASQGLDLAAAFLLDPGDTVLIDVPTYHLAMRILRDHPVHVVGVPSDAGGIIPDELARAVTQLRQRQQRPRLLYTIPTFHNPTGRVMPDERRAELLSVAAREELRIVEDDTLGSFAKSVAPGLRVGYITADAGIVARMVAGGLLDSGGGTTHFAATVLSEYAASGDYASQVDRFRAAYRTQRDRLLHSLAEHMPETVSWSVPAGGYFVWVQLPKGMNAEKLLPVASANGMEFLPANVFFLDQNEAPDALRLAFSMHPPDTLAEAGARLASAITRTPFADANAAG